MTIDIRTRLHKDVRALALDEVFDDVLPGAIAWSTAISPAEARPTTRCRRSDS